MMIDEHFRRYGNFHDCTITHANMDFANKIIEIHLEDVNFDYERMHPKYVPEPGILRFKNVKAFKLDFDEMSDWISDSQISTLGEDYRLSMWVSGAKFFEAIIIHFGDFEMVPIGKDKFEFTPEN